MILIQKVQANWRTRKRGSITSVLTLDIKNAYPTVRATPFAKICIRIKLPTELIKWFISFMSDRTIRFAFDGEISAIIGVNDGILQGSPVSPIMFLIFIQHVIEALEHRNEIITLNYVDDLAMITESSCTRTNSIRLQLALKQLIKAADEIQIQFNADKSEYIHFHKNRDPINIGVTLTFITCEGSKTVNVRPQEQFKWLGM
jgi:hypothetical protein